jgi:aminopeptidase
MKRASLVVLAAGACFGAAACGGGENPTHSASAMAAASFDLEGAAHEVVVRSARVQAGELVAISGGPDDIELMENIAVHVRRLGAHPLIVLNSDRLARRLYDDVPESRDTQRDEWPFRLVDAADVWIVVAFSGENVLAHVPQRRIAAGRAANVELYPRAAGTRTVEIGNVLYPSESRARQFGMSRTELAHLFWEGVQADPARLTASANAVAGALTAGSTIRITHPNGTDLTLGIGGTPPLINDGVVPTEPGTFQATWLPAGEVYIAVKPGSASGRVVLDRQLFQGVEYRDITLTFADGQLTAMESPGGLGALRDFLDAAPGGWDRLTALDIGINPGIASQRVQAWVPAGMVTISLGDNMWAGGDVDLTFYHAFHLPGSTVRVDDRVIVEDGVLKL